MLKREKLNLYIQGFGERRKSRKILHKPVRIPNVEQRVDTVTPHIQATSPIVHLSRFMLNNDYD